jgi:hypothetical protein
MKKLVLLSLVAAALLGVASLGFAATFLNFQVSITVRATDLNIYTNGGANKVAWGVMRPNQTVVGATPNTWTAVTPIYQVVNGGGANIDLQLYQVSAPSGWTSVAGAPGAARTGTQYRLFGAFTTYLNAPTSAAFDANDQISVGSANIKTSSYTTSTFQLAGEGANGYTGGYDVMPETYVAPDQYKGTRNLKFCFDTPTPALDTSANLDIYLTAQVNP